MKLEQFLRQNKTRPVHLLLSFFKLQQVGGSQLPPVLIFEEKKLARERFFWNLNTFFCTKNYFLHKICIGMAFSFHGIVPKNRRKKNICWKKNWKNKKITWLAWNPGFAAPCDNSLEISSNADMFRCFPVLSENSITYWDVIFETFGSDTVWRQVASSVRDLWFKSYLQQMFHIHYPGNCKEEKMKKWKSD